MCKTNGKERHEVSTTHAQSTFPQENQDTDIQFCYVYNLTKQTRLPTGHVENTSCLSALFTQ